MMYLPNSENLNIADFSHLFDNKAECYKLFWFHAIMNGVAQGRKNFTFEELIDDMIADAWYMVTEYHLNLGPRDTLEKAVNRIHDITGMLPSVKKEDIFVFLRACTDKEVNTCKRVLTLNVPYRLQAPLFHDFSSKDWDVKLATLAGKINSHDNLIYTFTGGTGLQSGIEIQDDWYFYLYENRQIIDGWIRYEMVVYLQRRNPNVPGIVDKLTPPVERKLEKVGKYWRTLTELDGFYDIYGDNFMTPKNISIDHFVPWSYVANDELWNLHPTLKSINSAKSNNLPEWDTYFEKLVHQEYKAYTLIWKYDAAFEQFVRCAREHINSEEVKCYLYKEDLALTEFGTRLEKVLLPVYQAAKNSGFHEWVYSA